MKTIKFKFNSNLGLPNMDSKDVEEIFKVVLTDDASQESQDPNSSNMLLISNNNMAAIPPAQNGVVMVQNQNHAPIMSPSRTGKSYLVQLNIKSN